MFNNDIWFGYYMANLENERRRIDCLSRQCRLVKTVALYAAVFSIGSFLIARNDRLKMDRMRHELKELKKEKGE